jgi:formate hydrogenlyase subunit 3/multisubunit Na+/H+ antiporter MnhD subunit
VLSIAVGVVHLLLVEEHSAESPIWGIGFLVMGISQIVYGGVMVFTKTSLRRYSIKRLFYGIGMAGNALFVGIFVLARTTGIFSPDGTPVNELELNGLMSIIIELLIVASLGYLVKDKKEKQEVEDLMHFSSNRRRQIP